MCKVDNCNASFSQRKHVEKHILEEHSAVVDEHMNHNHHMVQIHQTDLVKIKKELTTTSTVPTPLLPVMRKVKRKSCEDNSLFGVMDLMKKSRPEPTTTSVAPTRNEATQPAESSVTKSPGRVSVKPMALLKADKAKEPSPDKVPSPTEVTPPIKDLSPEPSSSKLLPKQSLTLADPVTTKTLQAESEEGKKDPEPSTSQQYYR